MVNTLKESGVIKFVLFSKHLLLIIIINIYLLLFIINIIIIRRRAALCIQINGEHVEGEWRN